MTTARDLWLVALLLGTTTRIGAQAAERAVFLVRLGKDTFAVETATIRALEFEADLRRRTPLLRVQRRITFSPTLELRSLDVTAGGGPQGDSARVHYVLSVAGDSAEVRTDAVGVSPARAQRIQLPPGAVPYTDLSGLALEMILRRAQFVGGDTVVVPLFAGAGRSLSVRVARIGTDSASLTIGAVEFRVRTDASGRMLGGVIPSQGAYIDRLPGGSPVARWAPAVQSYDAPADAPYVAEQVTIRTPAGIVLAGTLTKPADRSGVRLPAVVLITGSGSQDRDEAVPSLGAYRPFREIADTLSRRGIAVLRLDDRGVGGTSQGPATATSADFADDIRAAIAFLRARPDIAPERVGLVGHSEGGMIAPMIAATDSTLRAMVLIAGTARTGRAILSGQRRYGIDRDTTIVASRRDSVAAARDRASEQVYAQPGWLSFFANHDPLPVVRRVRAPTLILQGETDRQVTPEQAPMLAAALRAGGNRKVSVRTFPHMNHLMLDDPSGDPSAYRTLKSYRVRRDFLGALADWLAHEL
jgi:alpha-beta hydrolase superfamily lysophospholipase